MIRGGVAQPANRKWRNDAGTGDRPTAAPTTTTTMTNKGIFSHAMFHSSSVRVHLVHCGAASQESFLTRNTVARMPHTARHCRTLAACHCHTHAALHCCTLAARHCRTLAARHCRTHAARRVTLLYACRTTLSYYADYEYEYNTA